MPLILKNVGIAGFTTAISVPEHIHVELTDCFLQDGENGIVVRDKPSLMARLGLPEDTPVDILQEALSLLNENQQKDGAGKISLLMASKIGPYLANCANLVATVTGLSALTETELGQTIITKLKSL